MKGADCGAWQRQLIADGYDLSPYNDDEDFGGLTHNFTVSWQRERALTPDGVVGKFTRAAIGTPAVERELPTIIDPIAFVPARNFGTRNDRHFTRTDVSLIVIHSMEAAEASTTAENVARWAAGPHAPKASWHYAVDDDSIVQSVMDHHIAWHAPGANGRSIGIEHAGYARQRPSQWADPFSQRMLARSAILVARLCARWNIPVRKLDDSEVASGQRGICGHHDVSRAFRKSTHYDPGPDFPWDAYLESIRAAQESSDAVD